MPFEPTACKCCKQKGSHHPDCVHHPRWAQLRQRRLEFVAASHVSDRVPLVETNYRQGKILQEIALRFYKMREDVMLEKIPLADLPMYLFDFSDALAQIYEQAQGNGIECDPVSELAAIQNRLMEAYKELWVLRDAIDAIDAYLGPIAMHIYSHEDPISPDADAESFLSERVVTREGKPTTNISNAVRGAWAAYRDALGSPLFEEENEQ